MKIVGLIIGEEVRLVKKISVWLAALALVLVVTPVYANKPNGPAAYNGLEKGKSEVYHLELYEKDTDWNPVEGGAWGKVTFNLKKMSFVFNGHGLVNDTDYTLIRYVDWGQAVVCLGSGTADEYGEVHIQGDWLDGGVKVWLVTSVDVDCETGMKAWHPADYLFEYNTL